MIAILKSSQTQWRFSNWLAKIFHIATIARTLIQIDSCQNMPASPHQYCLTAWHSLQANIHKPLQAYALRFGKHIFVPG